jgi:FkbM family methyltransferase
MSELANSGGSAEAWGRLRQLSTEALLIPYRWLFTQVIAMRGNIVEIDGCKFAVGAPVINRKNRFLFNHYEPGEREMIRKYINPKLPVIELGSAVGVISCITNRLLERPEQHVAIEANPQLIPVLRENRELNGCRFEILHRAIAYDGAEAVFYLNENFTESSTCTTTDRPVRVATTTLEAVAEEYGFERFTLLCDIEGAEQYIITREAQVLSERVETLFIEIHDALGETVCDELAGRLQQLGFERVFQRDDDFVFRKNSHKVRDAQA